MEGIPAREMAKKNQGTRTKSTLCAVDILPDETTECSFTEDVVTDLDECQKLLLAAPSEHVLCIRKDCTREARFLHLLTLARVLSIPVAALKETFRHRCLVARCTSLQPPSSPSGRVKRAFAIRAVTFASQ